MAKAEKAIEQEEIKFPLATLGKKSLALYGITSSTFAGATYALDTSKEYTIKEVGTIINKWLEKEVR